MADQVISDEIGHGGNSCEPPKKGISPNLKYRFIVMPAGDEGMIEFLVYMIPHPKEQPVRTGFERKRVREVMSKRFITEEGEEVPEELVKKASRLRYGKKDSYFIVKKEGGQLEIKQETELLPGDDVMDDKETAKLTKYKSGPKRLECIDFLRSSAVTVSKKNANEAYIMPYTAKGDTEDVVKFNKANGLSFLSFLEALRRKKSHILFIKISQINGTVHLFRAAPHETEPRFEAIEIEWPASTVVPGTPRLSHCPSDPVHRQLVSAVERMIEHSDVGDLKCENLERKLAGPRAECALRGESREFTLPKNPWTSRWMLGAKELAPSCAEMLRQLRIETSDNPEKEKKNDALLKKSQEEIAELFKMMKSRKRKKSGGEACQGSDGPPDGFEDD